jgi:hypothetical protein
MSLKQNVANSRQLLFRIMESLVSDRGPGSSVGIATELRARRSGIEFRWGRYFQPVQTGPGPTQPPENGYWVFTGGKVRPGRAADHSPPSSAAVIEE